LYRYLLWIGLLGWWTGCNPPAPEQGPALARPLYFDLQSFLDRQVEYLQTAQPVVRKTVYDQQEVVETETVRNINWERELELFREIDLNRPALRDYFTLTRHTDPATGHITERYEKKPGAYTNVDFLEVELDATGQLRQLRAATQQDNPLFFTQHHLQLTTSPSTPTRIQSYAVSGVQKLILTDSVHYAVEAEVQE
jgi:hypothetical protein